jgi:hypothetical protein
MNEVTVEVSEPALLIRINQSYRHGMGGLALYEATRGVWRLGPNRERAKLALAVHHGTVLEVYEILEWHPGTSTHYETRTFEDVRARERWEFTGPLATDAIRQKYVGKSVAGYFTRGSQAPVVYVNIR